MYRVVAALCRSDYYQRAVSQLSTFQTTLRCILNPRNDGGIGFKDLLLPDTGPERFVTL